MIKANELLKALNIKKKDVKLAVVYANRLEPIDETDIDILHVENDKMVVSTIRLGDVDDYSGILKLALKLNKIANKNLIKKTKGL